ncbi:hypothetical protein [Azospirillum halopraeferens]|uniref:hypothetical protein n=1 Tax=Azospirillum halopraeferens TaxID=34010 RepID=UPI000417EE01|nr:hypothetical protein [Azospirillum halopraeferens]
MESLYCACCGRPFTRASHRGPAPLYCSRDCRRQMDVRRRAWADVDPATARWGMVRDVRQPARAAAAGR